MWDRGDDDMWIARGDHGDYVVRWDGERWTCTCMAGLFGRECKHVRAVRDELERGVRVMPQPISKIDFKRRFKSILPELNEVFGGYFYNSDALVAIHGKPGSGKTLFSLWECGYVSAQGGNWLYIDTEGGFKSMAMKWWPVIEKRFGKDKLAEGYVEVRKTLSSLHEFLGFKTQVVWVKEKMEFRVLETMKEAEIDRFVEKNDIAFIVVDSVSAPILTAINEEQQNRPARATATAMIMGKLVELQERYGVCVLTVHHSSWNPANPYETLAQMRGGKIVHHFAKRVLYIDARQKSDLANFRRLWVGRAEDVERFGDVVFFSIDDEGIKPVGIDVAYHAGLLTDNELEHVKDNPRWQKVLGGAKQGGRR